MRTRLILAVTAMAAFGAGACTSSPELKADATVTACTPGPDDGRPVAEGQVTNTSSKTSNFSVRIGFYDASDNKITEGLDVVTDVEPGTPSPFRITGIESLKGPVDCRVLGVTRNADPTG